MLRQKRVPLALPAALVALVALLAAPALAGGAGDDGRFRARLGGFQEVPPISTPARGELRAELVEDGDALWFALRYEGLEAPATAAHLHFGQRRVNGGVVAFLCGGGGKPACPAGTAGEVSGTITAADIVGPAAQGIEPGEFAEFVRALRAGLTYANVHTGKFPDGEIRGQVVRAVQPEEPTEGGE